MVTKNVKIYLTFNRIVNDVDDCWSIFFERPKDFVFEAGDWIDIQFEDRELNGGITYSISSSPTESEIRITFKSGLSEFKRALQDISVRDTIYINQYGNDYNFQLKKYQSSVLIAGGIGIAPFRSMVKEMHDSHDPNEVLLIYLNKNDNFLFKEELDFWAKQLPNVTIDYVSTKDITRKKREKRILSLIKDKDSNFYISGPPAMIEANEHFLIDNGVRVKDIRIDSFGGY
jgi:ferredoxin-NADP reductase